MIYELHSNHPYNVIDGLEILMLDFCCFYQITIYKKCLLNVLDFIVLYMYAK